MATNINQATQGSQGAPNGQPIQNGNTLQNGQGHSDDLAVAPPCHNCNELQTELNAANRKALVMYNILQSLKDFLPRVGVDFEAAAALLGDGTTAAQLWGEWEHMSALYELDAIMERDAQTNE